MGRVKSIILCGLLLTGFADVASHCMAGGKTSPEYLAVYSISFGIKLNMETNSNASLNWQQVARYVDVTKLNRQLSEPRKIFVLQEHYIFITNKWIVSEARNRQAILVRNQPQTDYEGKVGRYLVCWNGRYEETFWMSETDFQKHLKQSGITLPIPDPAEVAAAKTAVEALIAKERREHEMIVAAAPKPTWAEIRAVWGERIKSWFVAPTASGVSGGQIRWESVVLGVLVLSGLFSGGWYWLGRRK